MEGEVSFSGGGSREQGAGSGGEKGDRNRLVSKLCLDTLSCGSAAHSHVFSLRLIQQCNGFRLRWLVLL